MERKVIRLDRELTSHMEIIHRIRWLASIDDAIMLAIKNKGSIKDELIEIIKDEFGILPREFKMKWNSNTILIDYEDEEELNFDEDEEDE